MGSLRPRGLRYFFASVSLGILFFLLVVKDTALPLAANRGVASAALPLLPVAPYSSFLPLAAATAARGGVGDDGPRCKLEGTASGLGARFLGLPECLETGAQYTVTLGGNRPCPGGGDFWEVLLMGPQYLARVPSSDDGNGNHTLSLHLPHLSGGLLATGGYRLYGHLLFEGGAGFGGPGTDWKAENMLGLEDGLQVHLEFKGPGECSTSSTSTSSAASVAARLQRAQLAPAPDVPCALALPAAALPWRGFWLRYTGDPSGPCPPPFCAPGSTASIAAAMWDNNEAWVYRLPHCAFSLVSAPAARACLEGAHLLALGDSTMQDSVRNLLTDGMGIPGELFMEDGQFLPRRANLTHAAFPSSEGAGGPLRDFSLTLEFSGSPDVKAGGAGVRTYKDALWRKSLEARLRALPASHLWVNDAGLHSAQWAGDVGPQALQEVREVVRGHVVPFWLGGAHGARHVVYRTVSAGAFRHLPPPPSPPYHSSSTPLGYSSSCCAHASFPALPPPPTPPKNTPRPSQNVCPALEHRSHRGNPQSMEAYNALVLEALQEAVAAEGAPTAAPPRTVSAIDFFDMTFAWHLHPCCSDGGHYGRPPYYKFWRNGAVYTGANNLGVGPGFTMVNAKHFVDNMLHQIFLGAVCSST